MDLNLDSLLGTPNVGTPETPAGDAPRTQSEEALRKAKRAVAVVGGIPVDAAGFLLAGMNAAGGGGFTNPLESSPGSSSWIRKAMGVDDTAAGDALVDIGASFINPFGAAAAAGKTVASVLPLLNIGSHVKTATEVRTLGQLGITKEEIFQKTGAYLGFGDNQWRVVIEDLNSKGQPLEVAGKMTKSKLPYFKTAEGIVADVLPDFPALYDVFPEAKSIAVVFNGSLGMNSAAYNRGGSFLGLSTSPKITMGPQSSLLDATSSFLHEIQHAVQYHFGLPGGGNPTQFYPVGWAAGYKAADKAEQRAKDAVQKAIVSNGNYNMYDLIQMTDYVKDFNEFRRLDPRLYQSPEFRNWYQARSAKKQLEVVAMEAEDKYFRLAGEAESRFVEAMFKSQNYRLSPFSNYPIMPHSRLLKPDSFSGTWIQPAP